MLVCAMGGCWWPVLASQAVGDVGPAAQLAAALASGTLAAGTHAAKAGSRAMINTSPEPFTNWFASLGEDVAVVAGLWTALVHPVVFLVFLAVFVVGLIWLLPKLWRGIKRVAAFLTRPFRKAEPESVLGAAEPPG